MFPQLYNSAGDRVAELNNIIQDTATIKRVINGEFTFTFEATEQELKSEYFDVANRLIIENQTFDIKCVEQKHETDVVYKIQCEHVNYRLQDGEVNSYESFNFVGTPTEILTEILTGSGFSIGTVDFVEEVYLSVNNQTNKKALIYELAKLVEGEVDYTSSGFTINLLNSLGQDRGFQARFGRNLQGVTKTVDSRVLDEDGNIKVSYNVNLLMLKNTNVCITKGLQDLEVLDLGDAVRIIDEVIGLDVVNRVVSIEYNPLFQVNTQLEIANKLSIIVNTISRIDNTTVKKDDLYNGVKMGPIEGFVAERSDSKAKVVMNATEGIGIFSRSNILNPYNKNFSIDTEGNIVMTGKINLVSGSDVSTLGLKALAFADNADWNTNLLNIPNTLKSPNGNGLYLSSTNLGFYKDNAWKTYMDNNGNFYLGGTNGKLQWDAINNNLTINGTVTIGSGSTGISNLSDAGTLATKNSANWATEVSGTGKPANNATVGATWGSNLIDIPNTLKSPSGNGLYLTSTELGFYKDGAWKTYMRNDGNFYLGGTNGKLQWDATNDTLTIDGNMIGGSINITTDATVGNSIIIGDKTNPVVVGKGLYFHDNLGIREGFFYNSGLYALSLETERGINFDIGTGYDIYMGAGGLNFDLTRPFDIMSSSISVSKIYTTNADLEIGTTFGSAKLKLQSYNDLELYSLNGSIKVNKDIVFASGITITGLTVKFA